jgi:hypothetical protein
MAQTPQRRGGLSHDLSRPVALSSNHSRITQAC